MTWLAALVLASVEVSAERCERLDAAEVQRIVEVELSAAPPTTEPIVARLTCNGTAVRTEVVDPVTQKTLSRTVSVKGLGARGPARALALAIAELISASWSELLLTPRPAAAEERAERAAPAPEVAAKVVAALPPVAPRDTLRIEALGSARVVPDGAVVQWGGGARLVWATSWRLGLLVDVVIDHGEAARSFGRLSIDSVSGSLGPVVVFKPTDWLQVLVAIAGRFGAARFVGTPTDDVQVAGGALSGAWGGPALVAAASARLGPIVVGLGAESGWSLVRLTATADGARTAGLDGVWVGLGVHAGWAR